MLDESIGVDACSTIYNGDISRQDTTDIIREVARSYQSDRKDIDIYEKTLEAALQFSESDFYEALPNNPHWIQVKKGQYHDLQLDVPIIVRWLNK